MKRITLFSFLLLGMTFFYSCVKESSPSTNTPEKVTKLNIPSNFDWKTSANIVCNFTAQHDTKVEVSLTKEEASFATFIVGRETDNVYLNLPTSTKKVYVKYETKDGNFKTVELVPAGTTLSCTIPGDSKEYVAPQTEIFNIQRAIARTPQQNVGTIYYPARNNGWGTLMFEDLWPGYGDYDFNDLVANYKIQLYMQNNNKVNSMLIGIRVKAVGGSIPNDFYLTLTGVKGGEIDEITPYSSHNAAATAEMVQLNPGNSVHTPATFIFKDIKKNDKKPQGAIYLNTERGYEMPESDWVTVAYFVQFRNSIAIEDVTFDKFDFFIANTEREIHLGGFAPSLLGQSVYDNLATNSNNINPNKYYYSKTNLIWGLSIPADIPHAYENTDFLKAYPNFAKWAQSGGSTNTDWYEDKGDNRINANLVK